ncbi:MAG: DUF2497 domain-containing protein [Alphaproteobacteria bacterium]
MSDPKTQQEPSMEEILASIRRIISEDNQPEGEAPAEKPAEAAKESNGAAAEEDVIELTEVVEEPPAAPPASARAAEPPPPPAAELQAEPAHADEPLHDEAGDEPVLEMVDAAERGAEAAMDEGMAEPHEAPAARNDRIISAHAADQAMHAFGALASVLHGGDDGSGLPLGQGSRTIEDIVRDLLRPMLREWLDGNLPEIVQRLVQKEIREMVRRAED